MSNPRLRGLYAITPDDQAPTQQRLRSWERVLCGGARVIQYRDKRRQPLQRLEEAQALHHLCDQFGALLIINDDIELAVQAQADGVHLGREDLSVEMARKALGDAALIGISCYNQLSRAQAAAAAGADYLAFGSFYPSPTKPDAVIATPELIGQARRFGLPVVAIGGITAHNGAALIAAGADMLAVISALFHGADPEAAANEFSRLFD